MNKDTDVINTTCRENVSLFYSDCCKHENIAAPVLVLTWNTLLSNFTTGFCCYQGIFLNNLIISQAGNKFGLNLQVKDHLFFAKFYHYLLILFYLA